MQQTMFSLFGITLPWVDSYRAYSVALDITQPNTVSKNKDGAINIVKTKTKVSP